MSQVKFRHLAVTEISSTDVISYRKLGRYVNNTEAQLQQIRSNFLSQPIER